MERTWETVDDYPLSDRAFDYAFDRTHLGNELFRPGVVPIVFGPCSVESEAQLVEVASFIADRGLGFIRAGAYKPRTDPYAFQGLGLEGLQLLRSVADQFGLSVVTEVRDATNVEDVYELADVIQVGAKAMFDYGVLDYLGRRTKPVLIKKAFGATNRELLKMADFLSLRGNASVLLCERGVRSFEPDSRFSLDLAAFQTLSFRTNRKVWVDPSHAMGERAHVPRLASAAFVAGADGLLIEVHPEPKQALSDSRQQIDIATADVLLTKLSELAEHEGKALM